MSAPAPAAEPILPAEPVRLWRGLEQVPPGFGPCAVTLGVFDGMHRGHTRLVRRALRLGRARGVPTVLVTFAPHPATVLGLTRDTARLSTVEYRAERFVQRVLVERLHAEAVAVGANFTFGHRAAGTVDTLQTLGRRHGFTTHPVGLLHEADTRCSSSFIRGCLQRGDVEAAARALGRPYRVEGILRPASPHQTELVPAVNMALPAPGDYRGTLNGVSSIELRMARQGKLLVRTEAVWPGPAAVACTDRKEGL